ncbi:hypothetical protein [Fodinicola feengrottensis]|uniref:hypothetical protein n=1 Tax=Fodinicola feengrottensis TaxID=435914 RepID=UPI002442CB0C|nr:hypothetical protein [Fodinicola feengrottensis]
MNVRTGKDGCARPLSTAHGRRVASDLIRARPGASLRQIARESGISLGTARDVRMRVEAGKDPVPPQQRTSEHRQGGAVRPAAPMVSPVPRPREVVLPVDLSAFLQDLKKDPSLRFSESGRMLLRLFDAHSLSVDGWRRLADAVPSHCGDIVASVARRLSQSWLSFAEQVEQRQVEMERVL